jgi:hypothetical protein
MEQLMNWMNYVHAHPTEAGLVLVGLLGCYLYLLMHKSKMTRDVDKRLEQLRDERGDIYSTYRPPD